MSPLSGGRKLALISKLSLRPKFSPNSPRLTKQETIAQTNNQVDFLDTSGSMQFPAMRRLSITTGNAFLVVYALDDPNSFEQLKLCVAEIREARPDDFQEVPIVFAGNKCDLPREERKVTKEQVSNYVYYELPRLRTKVSWAKFELRPGEWR